MPVPTLITDLSATAASNSPSGSEAPTEGDNHLRTAYAFIRQLYDGVSGVAYPTLARLASTASAADGPALIVPSHALNYAAGTLGAWYNTYVTVKDRPYLATGDGTTDDAAAMNAALASGYKRIHFPFGTYKFNDHVTIPAGVSVTADPGTKWLSDGTADVIITGSATVKTVIEGILFDMASSTRQVYGESADNVTIRRCSFTGSTNNGLLMSVGPHYLLCVDCDFYDNGKAGLYVAGDASRAPEYIELRSCRSWGNGEGGQVVAGVGSRTSPAQTANWAIKVKLVDCESWGNGTTANSGFELVNMDGLTVTGCSAWDNREHGLSMQETRNFTITGGRYYENDFGGICPQSGYGNDYNPCEIGTITGVIMDGNAAVGFWCKERVLNVAVTGCHIVNNTLHNIRFSDLGGSLLKSEDVSFVNCFTEPSPGAAFTNSNASVRISFQAAHNEQAFPLQPNAHNMLSIATAVTINTRGTDEAWPSLVTLDNSTPVNVSRTAIAEAYDGRRLTLRAYLGGTVQIQNAAGNGTTLAGFINNTGAAVVMQAGKSLVYIGNGVDFVEEGS